MQNKNPLEKLLTRLDSVLAHSPLVKSLSALSTIDDRFKTGRPLLDQEILILISQHNSCEDWSRIRILQAKGLEQIHHNHFSGDILFSGFENSGTDSSRQNGRMGISYSRIENCIIGNACIYNVSQMRNQFIQDNVVLVNVGSLIANKANRFCLGQVIHPGNETGERSCWIWDELTLSDCEDALVLKPNEQKFFSFAVESKLSVLKSHFGIVSEGASILHTKQIENSWIGPYTNINGASLIKDSAILSSLHTVTEILSDAWIEFSLMQPGTKVDSSGKVSHSVLLSEVENPYAEGSQKNRTASPASGGAASITLGGSVSQSVIGPQTQVSKGEITASLVGPSVGFHHQALLISALWPEGRGNVAYGANVGSNHTGKKPDQEIRPGEGMFFGLGCTIKFPANFSDAPYSLIAAGLITQPQKITFPFSLLSQRQNEYAGLALTLNEITPGWMWSNNAYSLFRRGYKTLGHPSKSNGTLFESRIFHLSLAQKVFAAFKSLAAAQVQTEPYLDISLQGLGQNFLTAANRTRAQAAYRDYLSFFLMQAFAGIKSEQPAFLNEINEIFKTISGNDDFSIKAVKSFLHSEQSRIEILSQKVSDSFQRDQKRGEAIFSDYSDFHAHPKVDPIVLRIKADLKILKQSLEAFFLKA